MRLAAHGWAARRKRYNVEQPDVEQHHVRNTHELDEQCVVQHICGQIDDYLRHGVELPSTTHGRGKQCVEQYGSEHCLGNLHHDAEQRNVEQHHVTTARVLDMQCVRRHTRGQRYQHRRHGVEQCVKQRTCGQHCQCHRFDVEPHEVVLHRVPSVHE